MKISRGGKTGFEIFLPLFSFAIWSSGCGSIYECVKRKLKQGGALKRHIIGWQTLFSLFVIFPFIFLVLSNFGHVMKMVFFPFSARIFFPVPHFKMFPFHSGIVVCFCFFCLLNGEDREWNLKTNRALRSETLRDDDWKKFYRFHKMGKKKNVEQKKTKQNSPTKR